METLIQYADVVFVSKEFCIRNEWANPQEALDKLIDWSDQRRKTYWVFTWGSCGAYLASTTGNSLSLGIQHIPVVPVTAVVDSVGAGDTFIASFIAQAFAILRKDTKGLSDEVVTSCIQTASSVAGAKLAYVGFPSSLRSAFASSYRAHTFHEELSSEENAAHTACGFRSSQSGTRSSPATADDMNKTCREL